MLQNEKNLLKSRRQKTAVRVCAVALLALTLVLAPFAGLRTAKADGGLNLSTDFPGVTINTGEDVTFELNVDNESATPQNVALSIDSMPKGWSAYFEGNGKPVSRVYVGDASSDSNSVKVDLVVTVPDDATQDTHSIVVSATGQNGAVSKLQLDINVSEQEFTQGKLTSQYQELEGSSSSKFSYSMSLTNNSSVQQSYSLSAQAPDGWQVKFSTSDGQQIASLNVDASRSESITVAITPPVSVDAGTYTIPVAAISANETLSMNYTVVITGTYAMTLTTPSGLMSLDAVAGKSSNVTLTIQNTGTAPLEDVSLTTASTPTDWTVTFDKSKIDSIAAGESAEVTATIQAANDAITGDYVVSISAKNSEVSSQADFRVTVKTSTVWGIVGIVIIAAVVVGMILVFRKFGRR